MSEDKKNETQAAFTPDDIGEKVLDERSKDQKEFDNAFDNLFEEPKEEKIADPATSDDGEGQTEPTDQIQADTSAEGEGQVPVVDGTDQAQDNTPATEPAVNDGIDYKARSEELAELLTKEQQKTSTWNGRISAANKRADDAESKVKDLEAKVVELEKVKPAKVEDKDFGDEELDTFFSDFPEMKKPFELMLRKAMGNRVDTGSPAKTDEPTSDQGAQTADDSKDADQKLFEDTIGHAHSDWRYHITTGKLLAWIDTQPDYIKETLKNVYQGGTAKACIDLLTNYKLSTGQQKADGETNPAPKQADTKAAKQKKLDALKEVKSSGAVVDPTKPGAKHRSFDETAAEIGL